MARRVLVEEEYLRILEGIIRRDYFPDLPSLLLATEESLTLESFQANYTSEDDASFNHLVKKYIAKSNHARQNNLLPCPQNLLLLQTDQVTCKTVINPENTTLQPPSVKLEKKNSVINRRKLDFVPMSPATLSRSPTLSTTSSSLGNLSPAARLLLKSVRKKQLSTRSPFGGQTPQRKQPKFPSENNNDK